MYYSQENTVECVFLPFRFYIQENTPVIVLIPSE